jgi:holo-[acyl-carrier protein] synthase
MDAIALDLAIAPVAALPPPGDPTWRDWLSPAELAYCGGLRYAGEHLVARAMAKQAAANAVGWPGPVPWADLEIRRQPDCAPELVVVADLRQWCVEQGLAAPGVSLTHAGGHAAAVAWSGPNPSIWR